MLHSFRNASSTNYLALSVLLAGFFFAFAPLQTSLAATAYLETPSSTITLGDTVLVTAHLDTSGVSANVVEGDLLITDKRSVIMRELSVAGANLSFWSRKPSWSEPSSTISFIGGVPGGFNQSNGLLFTVAFTANKAGVLTFTPAFTAYANDGKATVLPMTAKPLTLTIIDKNNPETKDAWKDVVAADNSVPELLTVDIGQDPDLFNGKLFLTLHATDNDSGIAYFEIKEGTADAIRTGNTYVLQDQSRKTPITVSVYDKAGNVRTVGIPLPSQARAIMSTAIKLVIGLCIAFAIYLFAKRFTKK